MSTEVAKDTLSPLEQILVDTIAKSSKVGGEIYDGAKAVTVQSIDFAKEQIPQVIEELLLWKFVEAGFNVLVGVIILFALYKLITKLTLKIEDDFGKAITTTISGSIAVIVFISTMDEIKNMIYIAVAPKIYLIEYATELVQKYK
jgi:flagellar biosynthesis/type III secretory pathway M-ring protein FliF/YscJ